MTLFGPEPVAATLASLPNVERPPKWSANGTRARCDRCTRGLVDGTTSAAMSARWRREHDGRVELFCYDHARPVRDADDAVARRLTGKAA